MTTAVVVASSVMTMTAVASSVMTNGGGIGGDDEGNEDNNQLKGGSGRRATKGNDDGDGNGHVDGNGDGRDHRREESGATTSDVVVVKAGTIVLDVPDRCLLTLGGGGAGPAPRCAGRDPGAIPRPSRTTIGRRSSRRTRRGVLVLVLVVVDSIPSLSYRDGS